MLSSTRLLPEIVYEKAQNKLTANLFRLSIPGLTVEFYKLTLHLISYWRRLSQRPFGV